MSEVELQCPWTGCDYKTPKLEGNVAIQMLQLHYTAQHPVAVTAKQEKAKLPTLEMMDGNVTEAALGVFKQRLSSYKQLARLQTSEPDTVLQGLPIGAYNQLYARFGEALTNQTEDMVLQNIANLMVRPKNKLSHVLKLQRMRQEHGQTVMTFSANIRAAARSCGFQVKCECQKVISYEEDMVLYQLLSGLEDTNVQADLLVKTKLDLAEAEKYAVDKEMAKRSEHSMASKELSRIKFS